MVTKIGKLPAVNYKKNNYRNTYIHTYIHTIHNIRSQFYVKIILRMKFRFFAVIIGNVIYVFIISFPYFDYGRDAY